MAPRVLSSVFAWAETIKLSHSIFALPFAIIAVVLAGRNLVDRDGPHWGQIALVVGCMVAARSVAMTFNRIADARIDARNPRTAGRSLPAGRLTLSAAWTMLFLSALVFMAGCFGFLIWYGNDWPSLLGGPILFLLCGYSLTKRFTKFSHVYLGAAIGLSPGAAWLAIDPTSVGWATIILMIAVTCWIAGFDIIYACQDIDVDRREGLHSLPASIGPARALSVARALHAVAAIALLALAPVAELGDVYLWGVALAATLLVVENSLVRPGDYRHVNVAFFTVNGIVSLVLAAAVIIDVAI